MNRNPNHSPAAMHLITTTICEARARIIELEFINSLKKFNREMDSLKSLRGSRGSTLIGVDGTKVKIKT